MLLFVKAHAPKYVRMGVCFWIWWYCSSEADRVLHDEYFFTKKTADGRFIWCNRFVEWFNKDVREYLGKHAKPNQELLVTRTAMLLKERKRWKAAASNQQRTNKRAERNIDEPVEKSLAISPIFCSQMDLIAQWNIWGEGDVLVGKGESTVAPYCFSDPSGKHQLNINLLFDISAAGKTLVDYFSKFHLEEKANSVQRPETGEDGVSL